jgi:hypothetical protein
MVGFTAMARGATADSNRLLIGRFAPVRSSVAVFAARLVQTMLNTEEPG